MLRQGCAWAPLLFHWHRYMRQNEDTRGINIEGTEHKLACYADDILIYLVQPTHSLPKLMQLFELYGQLSGHNINIGKTI